MSTAAESVRRYSRFFKSQQAMDVLDYGTGSMRNAVYLAQEGFSVYAADLPEQVERLRNCPALMHVERLLATDELPRSNLNVVLVLSEPIQTEKGFELSAFAPWMYLGNSCKLQGDFSIPQLKE